MMATIESAVREECAGCSRHDIRLGTCIVFSKLHCFACCTRVDDSSDALWVPKGEGRVWPVTFEPKKRCKLCRGLFDSVDMAIEATQSRSGYWQVLNASWCAACAEKRAEGVKDEDGDMKTCWRAPRYQDRLKEGFKMLIEHGFGDPWKKEEE